MNDNELKQLSTVIASRRCVLFAGAGFTSNSGGACWSELVQSLTKHFKYSSPLDDNFQIIDDLCKKNGYDNIYKAISERLKLARITEPLTKLVALPWFSVFTTNYDTALETALVDNQKLAVKTVLLGDEFSLTGIPSEILCVKLMGSLEIPPHQPGSMVIDPGDLIQAEINRSQIFDLLERHAANLSFLFVGYSFDDAIFIKILDKLNKILGRPVNTHFAVFKDKPTPAKQYLFDQYNIKVIVSDLKDFTDELVKHVALRNPSDFSIKSFRIGPDIIPINVSRIGGFLSRYNPVLSEDFNAYVDPNSFFKGYQESLNPFELNWHFHKEEIDTIVKSVLERNGKKKEAKLISVEGIPGSGKTISIMAAVHRLITQNRAVAIRIPNFAIKPIPSADEFSTFLEEINKATKEMGVKSPENFIFWADFTPSDEVIAQFIRLSHNADQGVTLIYEDSKASQIEFSLFRGFNKINVDMDAELCLTKKTELTAYLLTTISQHKLPQASKEEIEKIISEEKMFLPIMYRTLDPARRSINNIIEQEFSKIADKDAKNCILICSLASALDLDIPVALVRSALNKISGKNYTYTDIFYLSLKKAGVFIKDYQDFRFNQFFSIYHPLIAKQITNLSGKDEMNKILISLAEAVDIRALLEADFIRSLFIDKGVNGYKRIPLPFSREGLETALEKLKTRQPARPILHHLARLYSDNNINDKRIVLLLEEALAEPRESYMLFEKKGNILTTLANIKWNQRKQDPTELSRDDDRIKEIMALLDAARTEEVQNMRTYNIHAYDVQARILKELAQNSKNESIKLLLINDAINIVLEGLELYGDDPRNEQLLKSLQIELLSEVATQGAIEKSEEMLKEGNGVGYYTLAEIEYYKNSDPVKAEQLLDIALKADNYPAAAIVLKIELSLMTSVSPDYKYLLKLILLLLSKPDFIDKWKTMYYKGIIYAINGDFKEANKQFYLSSKRSPGYLQRRVQHHWKENGKRKIFQGKVSSPITEREGRIYSHNIPGCADSIFFDPRAQIEKQILKPGLVVIFELGFSPKGPIAFDVRPHTKK